MRKNLDLSSIRVYSSKWLKKMQRQKEREDITLLESQRLRIDPIKLKSHNRPRRKWTPKRMSLNGNPLFLRQHRPIYHSLAKANDGEERTLQSSRSNEEEEDAIFSSVAASTILS